MARQGPLFKGIMSGVKLLESSQRLGLTRESLDLKRKQLEQEANNNKFARDMAALKTLKAIGVKPNIISKFFKKNIISNTDGVFDKFKDLDDDAFITDIASQFLKLEDKRKKGEISMEDTYIGARGIALQNPESVAARTEVERIGKDVERLRKSEAILAASEAALPKTTEEVADARAGLIAAGSTPQEAETIIPDVTVTGQLKGGIDEPTFKAAERDIKSIMKQFSPAFSESTQVFTGKDFFDKLRAQPTVLAELMTKLKAPGNERVLARWTHNQDIIEAGLGFKFEGDDTTPDVVDETKIETSGDEAIDAILFGGL